MAFNLKDTNGKSIWSAKALENADLAKVEKVLKYISDCLGEESYESSNGRTAWNSPNIEDSNESKIKEVIEIFCRNLKYDEIENLRILVRDGSSEDNDHTFEFSVSESADPDDELDETSYNLVDAVQNLIDWLRKESSRVDEAGNKVTLIVGTLEGEGELEDVGENTLLGQIVGLIDEIKERLDNVDGPSGRLKNAEDIIDDLQENVEALEECVSTNSADIDNLDQRVGDKVLGAGEGGIEKRLLIVDKLVRLLCGRSNNTVNCSNELWNNDRPDINYTNLFDGMEDFSIAKKLYTWYYTAVEGNETRDNNIAAIRNALNSRQDGAADVNIYFGEIDNTLLNISKNYEDGISISLILNNVFVYMKSVIDFITNTGKSVLISAEGSSNYEVNEGCTVIVSEVNSGTISGVIVDNVERSFLLGKPYTCSGRIEIVVSGETEFKGIKHLN